MSGYAKYIKELVKKKRVINCETIALPQTYGERKEKDNVFKRVM